MRAEKAVVDAAATPGALPPAPGSRPKPGIRAATTSISNEVAKGLIDLWRGKTAALLELVLFGIMFLVLTYAIGHGTLRPSLVAPLTVGFVAYLFFHMQTNRLFWGLLGEIQSGTLEQLYLSPLPPWMLTAGLTAASILEAAITALLLLLGVRLVTPVTIPLRWAAVLPLVLLVLASVGYSLILGGLTLRFKRIEILKELFQLVVLIFGGVFISLDRLPGWMAAIARLLPLTPGVEALRKTLLDGASLSTLATDGTLLWLVGNTAAYVALGIVIFRWCERIAKRRGTLGRY
jgi:ABC-type polysaccharide/polyol phosphate export permease